MSDTTLAFSTVLCDEWNDAIRQRRLKVEGRADDGSDRLSQEGLPAGDEDAKLRCARLWSLQQHVTGLCFSGGGIRAGTFAVGFLQGLGSLGLLRRFDYLSTVSGGGYAGGWIAGWLKRQGGDPGDVERQLSSSRLDQATALRRLIPQGEVVDEEPEPLRHLRAFSSYLAPHAGLTTPDTWTVILIWVRNVTVNLMVLLPLAMLGVVLTRLVVIGYRSVNPVTLDVGLTFRVVSALMVLLGLAALSLASWTISRSLREFRRMDPRLRIAADAKRFRTAVQNRIILPAVAGALLLTLFSRLLVWWLGVASEDFRPGRESGAWSTVLKTASELLNSSLGLLQWPSVLFFMVIFAAIMGAGAVLNGLGEPRARWRRQIGASIMAGATGGALFVLLLALIKEFAQASRPDLMAVFATPLALLVGVAMMVVEVVLLGRTAGEAEREWWASISARIALAALFWLVGTATVLYVPGLFLCFGGAARAVLASGWLASAAFGVLSGRYVLPRLRGSGALTLTSIAAIASGVFLAGLLGAVSLLGAALMNTPALRATPHDELGPFAYYLAGVNEAGLGSLIMVAVGSALLFGVARHLIDVNLFSLNAMYANRLTRCYLGASRAVRRWPRRWGTPRDPQVDVGATSLTDPRDPVVSPNDPESDRDPNPLTEFDPHDDLDLRDLRIGAGVAAPARSTKGRDYWGPHLLINTTLNLVGSQSLAIRDRKGESFTLSPLYCGSKRTGYAKLGPKESEEAVDPNLTLGRAIAISGAAVDPNMSFYQSAPLTALLTIFDARLGYWIEKPKSSGWTAKSPRVGDFSLLLTEFFGRTDSSGPFIHISDGGHFENLGVYELIRRRCRYIVALDAGSDPDASDDNLANLIRLCRIDFGVRIKLDTAPLVAEAPARLTKAHFVVGSVFYDDVDRTQSPGVLVYVKVSMTGDESPDLQKYARENPRFPHDPTDLRQSFDEKAFEGYRSLGDHIAWRVFAEAARKANEGLADVERCPHLEYVPRLFGALEELATHAALARNL